MIQEFAFKCKGSTTPPTSPLKHFTNYDKSEKGYNLFNEINDISSLKKWVEFFLEEKYQSKLIVSEDTIYIYCLYTIIDEFFSIKKDTPFADRRIFSKTFTTGGLFPYKRYWDENFFTKIDEFERKFKEELILCKAIHDKLLVSKIENCYEIFLDIIVKNNKSKQNFEKLESLKSDILNDNTIIEKYESFMDKYQFDVNKQGIDGKQVFLLNYPTVITSKQKEEINQFKINNIKIDSGLLYNLTMPYNEEFKGKFEIKNVLLFLKRKAKQLYAYKRYENLDEAFLDIISSNLRVQNNTIIFKNKGKEYKVLIMKTNWYNIGKAISKSIWLLHKEKDDKNMKKSIAATKKELSNALTNKNSSKRAFLIWNKYIQKFSIDTIYSNIDGLECMDDIGLTEFNMGLYIMEEN